MQIERKKISDMERATYNPRIDLMRSCSTSASHLTRQTKQTSKPMRKTSAKRHLWS